MHAIFWTWVFAFASTLGLRRVDWDASFDVLLPMTMVAELFEPELFEP